MFDVDYKFKWNDDFWIIIEVCLDRYGKRNGMYLCTTTYPFDDIEPCYWTEEEIKTSK